MNWNSPLKCTTIYCKWSLVAQLIELNILNYFISRSTEYKLLFCFRWISSFWKCAYTIICLHTAHLILFCFSFIYFIRRFVYTYGILRDRRWLSESTKFEWKQKIKKKTVRRAAVYCVFHHSFIFVILSLFCFLLKNIFHKNGWVYAYKNRVVCCWLSRSKVLSFLQQNCCYYWCFVVVCQCKKKNFCFVRIWFYLGVLVCCCRQSLTI